MIIINVVVNIVYLQFKQQKRLSIVDNSNTILEN